MPVPNPTKNRNLIRKAAEAEARRRADDALRQARRSDPADQIRVLLTTPPDRATDVPVPFHAPLAIGTHTRVPLLRLLSACVGRSALVDRDSSRAAALIALSQWVDHWMRDPADWRPASHNPRRQFASLARHLLARYPVPPWMDAAWQSARDDHRSAEQAWFVHVGGGGNLRRAAELPFPLTKMAAHHAMAAPADLGVRPALVWGWCRATGAGDRLASALVAADAVRRLGDAPPADDVLRFWESVVRFFAAHDPLLDRSQVPPMVDYLEHQKFVPVGPVAVGGVFRTVGPPQPGLSMQGRDPATLASATEAWHRRLARATPGRDLQWSAGGITGLDRIEGAEGNQRRFLVEPLLSAAALRAEGAAMHHCVFTYARRCHAGQAAIYSLKSDDGNGLTRRATAEVDVRHRQVVQIRGPYNRRPDAVEQRVLRAWANSAGLTFGRYALGLV